MGLYYDGWPETGYFDSIHAFFLYIRGGSSEPSSIQTSDSTVISTETTSRRVYMVATPLPQMKPNQAIRVIQQRIRKLNEHIAGLDYLANQIFSKDSDSYDSRPSIHFALNDLYSCIRLMQHRAESCRTFYQDWLNILTGGNGDILSENIEQIRILIVDRLKKLITAIESTDKNQTEVVRIFNIHKLPVLEHLPSELMLCNRKVCEVFQFVQELLKELQEEEKTMTLTDGSHSHVEQEQGLRASWYCNIL